MIKKLFFALFLFIWSPLVLCAQDKEAEMADALRADGKIYTVVAVVLLVLCGLLAYLFFTERKLKNLEKRISK